MAMRSVRELVHRLMSDAGLRGRLHQDPDGVFAGYDLTPQEKAAVLSVGLRYSFATPSGTTLEISSQDWWAGPET